MKDNATTQDALQTAEAALGSAKAQIDVLKAQIEQTQSTLRGDQANLSYTTITSPIDGVVGNRTLRTGQFVQAGTQLMSLVPASGAYIIANYKETQLTDVRPGQPVAIKVDTFPGTTIRGHVQSLAPASGLEFALLPPDNATGNFTKIVQRIPVRIAIDRDDPLAGQLRPGMSVEPSINTRGEPQTARGE